MFFWKKSITLCVIFTFALSQNSFATNIQEVYTVITRYINNPSQVGEIAPISAASGNELAKFVGESVDQASCCYLEAGGGCGAVSVCIAKKLRLQDHLDVIEIDPEMCAILKDRLKDFANVSVHCCSILDWQTSQKYDAIICTLPFNSLGVEFTQATLQHFKTLAHPHCVLSYVEYPIVGQFLQYFYGQERKQLFRNVQSFMKNVREQNLQEESMVYFNVPPLAVYHLTLA